MSEVHLHLAAARREAEGLPALQATARRRKEGIMTDRDWWLAALNILLIAAFAALLAWRISWL